MQEKTQSVSQRDVGTDAAALIVATEQGLMFTWPTMQVEEQIT